MDKLDNYRLREMNFDCLRHIYKTIHPMELDNEQRLKIGVVLIKALKETKELVK